MSGFTKVEYGVVTIKHHSTSSLIEFVIKKKMEVSQGVFEDSLEHQWFDYREFYDLYEAMKTVQEIDGSILSNPNQKLFTSQEIKEKLLQINPQINEDNKNTNPFIYHHLKKWYDELNK